MSCLRIALVCLVVTAVAVAGEDLADAIKKQLSDHNVLKSPIALMDVPVNLIKGESKETAKASTGIVTFKNLEVTVDSRTSNELAFTVTGDASCTFGDYRYLKKHLGKWTSSSPRGQNSFKVTTPVANCAVNKPYVESVTMEGIGDCEPCYQKKKFSLREIKFEPQKVSRVADQITYEVKVKINQAIKAATNDLNLERFGFAGC